MHYAILVELGHVVSALAIITKIASVSWDDFRSLELSAINSLSNLAIGLARAV